MSTIQLAKIWRHLRKTQYQQEWGPDSSHLLVGGPCWLTCLPAGVSLSVANTLGKHRGEESMRTHKHLVCWRWLWPSHQYMPEMCSSKKTRATEGPQEPSNLIHAPVSLMGHVPFIKAPPPLHFQPFLQIGLSRTSMVPLLMTLT